MVDYNVNRTEENILKLLNGIEQPFIFSDSECKVIESRIEELIKKAKDGKYKPWTIDETLLRKKYFFGERYTYGSQMCKKGPGMEFLYPKRFISPIPFWIYVHIINPLIMLNIIPPNFVNSVTINDYQPRGCIVSHIDPLHIFDRPIVSVNLFSESTLSFGCKFSFKPIRCSEPTLCLPLPRGVVTLLSGFAANEITHCVRPEDTKYHRAVILLRRVLPNAPRLSESDTILKHSSIASTIEPLKAPADLQLPKAAVTKIRQKLSSACSEKHNGGIFKRFRARKTSLSENRRRISSVINSTERIFHLNFNQLDYDFFE